MDRLIAICACGFRMTVRESTQKVYHDCKKYKRKVLMFLGTEDELYGRSREAQDAADD